MAKDIFYPQTYICGCGEVQKHYVWTSKINTETHHCTACNTILNFQNLPCEEEEISLPTLIGDKMTSDQIKKDRRKRSKNHFEKEVMPYLPKQDQKDFAMRGYRNK